MTVQNPITLKYLQEIVARFDETGTIREQDLAWFIKGVELTEKLLHASEAYHKSSSERITELSEKLLAAEIELFVYKSPENTKESANDEN